MQKIVPKLFQFKGQYGVVGSFYFSPPSKLGLNNITSKKQFVKVLFKGKCAK